MVLIPLIFAGLADAVLMEERRSRAAELKNRLGGFPVPSAPSTRARLDWWGQRHPLSVAVQVSAWLRKAGVDALSHVPDPFDGAIPWLFREAAKERAYEKVFVGQRGGLAFLMGHDTGIDWRALRDWYATERPDLMRLDLHEAQTVQEDWHEELAARDGGELVPDGNIVHDLGGGWTVQRLRDRGTIRKEGESMQNCLQRGYYDEHIQENMLQVYSIRMPSSVPGFSRPVVTMAFDVEEDRFVEIKGRQNKVPALPYRPKVWAFLDSILGPEERWKAGMDGMMMLSPGDEHADWFLPLFHMDGGNIIIDMYDAGLNLKYPLSEQWFRDLARTSSLQTPASAYAFAANIDEVPRDDTREAASRDGLWGLEYALYVDEKFHPVTYRAVVIGATTGHDRHTSAQSAYNAFRYAWQVIGHHDQTLRNIIEPFPEIVTQWEHEAEMWKMIEDVVIEDE